MFHKRNADTQKQNRRLIGLRGKLLLISLTLLIFPFAGISYLNELEQFLKNNHAQSVLTLAKTISTSFNDNSSLIRQNRLLAVNEVPLYSVPLSHAVIIDGYSDDWLLYQHNQHHFNDADNNTILTVNISNDELFYYFLISIPKSHHPTDRLIFKYEDFLHQINEYEFQFQTPGWISAKKINSAEAPINNKLRGEWQENNQGYNLEFKFPLQAVNQFIAFEFITYQNGQSFSTHQDHSLNPLLHTDTLNQYKLNALLPENTQLWLINQHGYINAKIGRLVSNQINGQFNFSIASLLRRLYLLSMGFPEHNNQQFENIIRLNGNQIKQTLAGEASIQWLDKARQDRLSLAVSTPIYDSEKNVIGALILKQDNDTLLTLQDKTFESILLVTLLLFFLVGVSLLLFAGRLLRRIIRLRNDTDKAITNDGGISNQLYRKDNDEIGDLARSFAALLSQIEQNNEYLKTLSSRLTHELRTPITIIKSSLENIDLSRNTTRTQDYLHRAHEGCQRLNSLLHRMGEASRIEHSIEAITKEKLDYITFVENYVSAMRSVHPDIEWQFHSQLSSLKMMFSPDLMAQYLDKIIANAISFRYENSPVHIAIVAEEKWLHLEITNEGPYIDTEKLNLIFNSLTSFRETRSDQVHLGLGLYIARLIADFHQANLTARNNKEQSVSIILSLPVTHSME
jgi:dedicated sortase system histidine kinase